MKSRTQPEGCASGHRAYRDPASLIAAGPRKRAGVGESLPRCVCSLRIDYTASERHSSKGFDRHRERRYGSALHVWTRGRVAPLGWRRLSPEYSRRALTEKSSVGRVIS